jgi:hypothetical protein
VSYRGKRCVACRCDIRGGVSPHHLRRYLRSILRNRARRQLRDTLSKQSIVHMYVLAANVRRRKLRRGPLRSYMDGVMVSS